MHELADDMQRKLAASAGLVPRNDYDDLTTLRSLDGREVGGVRVYKGSKIEKLVVARMSMGPGVDFTYVHALPRAEFNIPRFIYSTTVMGPKVVFDVDLYPAIDLASAPEYFKNSYGALGDIYNSARSAEHFSWTPSEIPWVRASCSPYYFMSFVATEHKGAVVGLLRAYFDQWLRIWEQQQPLDASLVAAIEQRRTNIFAALIAGDPHRARLETVLGASSTLRLAHALLRGPDEVADKEGT